MARVLISMSNDFLNKVDSIANSEQRTRSELIREALKKKSLLQENPDEVITTLPLELTAMSYILSLSENVSTIVRTSVEKFLVVSVEYLLRTLVMVVSFDLRYCSVEL